MYIYIVNLQGDPITQTTCLTLSGNTHDPKSQTILCRSLSRLNCHALPPLERRRIGQRKASLEMVAPTWMWGPMVSKAVSQYIYIYIHTYIHTYVYIDIYMRIYSIHICVSLSLHRPLHTHTHNIYIYIYIYLFIYLFTYWFTYF